MEIIGWKVLSYLVSGVASVLGLLYLVLKSWDKWLDIKIKQKQLDDGG